MTDPTIKIHLKEIRTRLSLSLSATETLTGVSKAMLGQIERGESSPTIATLWKLCKGFQLPLSSLITEPSSIEHRFAGSITVQTLFPFDESLGSETFVVGLAAGLTHRSDPHREGVIEDVFGIDGDFEVYSGGHWQSVQRGHSFRFAADQPHGYRNLGPFPVHIHNTIHYPNLSQCPS